MPKRVQMWPLQDMIGVRRDDANPQMEDIMSDTKNSKSKTPMTKPAAKRIQKHADSTNTNQSFKSRATRAATKNSKKG